MLKKKKYTCQVGDIVMHREQVVWVSEIISQGAEDKTTPTGRFFKGQRSSIAVCRIMPDNGQILKRNPRYASIKWNHMDRVTNLLFKDLMLKVAQNTTNMIKGRKC